MALEHEKLLPALIKTRKEQPNYKTPTFIGAINVSPIQKCLKTDLDIKLDEFIPKTVKQKQFFNTYKQEQIYRLNRQNKLRVNKEIINYIKNSSNKINNTNKTIKKKNENEQIKDAAKQVQEINFILAHNKKHPNKSITENRNDELSFFPSNKITKRNPSKSSVDHTCMLGLKNKIPRHNTTLTIKQHASDSDYKDTDLIKDNSTKSEVIHPQDLLGKIKNQRNKKNIKNAIDSLNKKLTYSKERILKDYEAGLKRVSDYKKTKYRSIKDIKLDEEKLRNFEEEINVKNKLAEDVTDLKILYKNKTFEPQEETDSLKDKKIKTKLKNYINTDEDLYELKITSDLKEEKEGKESAYLELRKKIELNLERINKHQAKKEEILTSLLSNRDKSPTKKDFVVNTKDIDDGVIESNSKAVGNENYKTELEKSILKSDYLTKEFHMAENIQENEELIVNWADKFKIVQPKNWAKSIDYFLT